MDFELSEEQQLVQLMARDFAKEKIEATYKELLSEKAAVKEIL